MTCPHKEDIRTCYGLLKELFYRYLLLDLFFLSIFSEKQNLLQTVPSSMSNISGSKYAATAKARRTYIPEEYRLTGVSINFLISAKSIILSNLCLISAFVIPRIAPLRNTFSRPVNSA